MKIHIPNSAFLGNINAFLKQFDPSSPDALEITANQKWVSVHPVVLSMIAALGMTVQPEHIHCEQLEAKSAGYIVRMGLFKMLKLPPPTTTTFEEHASEGRFVPLLHIRNSGELTKFITEMIPLLHLEEQPEQAKTIGYIISELVGNVLDHADAANGAILCAQYFKKSNTIGIGIADTGVGIKATISRAYRVGTDVDAIRLALTPGITGTTRKAGGTEQNAGAGLFFIKAIADVNRDFFVMYSGTGFYKLLKKKPSSRLQLYADPFADRHSRTDDFPSWHGTVVGVDITLDQTREFSSLLGAIRKIYAGLLHEKKRAARKKPRFI